MRAPGFSGLRVGLYAFLLGGVSSATEGAPETDVRMAATPEFRYTFVIPFGGIEDGYVEGRFDGTGLTGSKLSTQGEGPREVSGTLRARFVERSGAGRASSRR